MPGLQHCAHAVQQASCLGVLPVVTNSAKRSDSDGLICQDHAEEHGAPGLPEQQVRHCQHVLI